IPPIRVIRVAFLPARRPMIRIGLGYDSHRFAKPGPLVLGGISIPFDQRLEGHSDGDAIAHAITDAVLGAAGAGDIGEMFSNLDAANKGRNSIEMLKLAVSRVKSVGWHVQQVDVVVVTEQPKIAEHRDEMQRALAFALQIKPGDISIKGKSNEKMGWIGRGEGLGCMAIAVITENR
ncbi:MAG TPA: 2-C-methyl-D-erythritol 2,4-cyclodiphosphate synthase, partial [Gemmatimonadaceae bacterium]